MDKAPVLVVGGGPSGLMAAQVLATRGLKVIVLEKMVQPGLKFLRAGRGGLNLTHGQDLEDFLAQYHLGAESQNAGLGEHFLQGVRSFGPSQIQKWVEDLGMETFQGSSGKIFPKEGAGKLLKGWLERLNLLGVQIFPQWVFLSWEEKSRAPGERSGYEVTFQTPQGKKVLETPAMILALGGASWSHLGSRGDWAEAFKAKGLRMAPWEPANCGFQVGWSRFFLEKYGHGILKNIRVSLGRISFLGDLRIRDEGLEGRPLYALSREIRQELNSSSDVLIYLDLLPDFSIEAIAQKLTSPRGSSSMGTYVKKHLKLSPLTQGLLREGPNPWKGDLTQLPGLLKAFPLRLTGTLPLEGAISSAGGLGLEELDGGLMVRKFPGVFCAGEMLDWEAPTGGYLLTGCLSQGHQAGQGCADYLLGP